MKKKTEERKSEYAKQPPELFNESMLDGEVIRQTPNFLKKTPTPTLVRRNFTYLFSP